jgi:hypothetical protein
VLAAPTHARGTSSASLTPAAAPRVGSSAGSGTRGTRPPGSWEAPNPGVRTRVAAINHGVCGSACGVAAAEDGRARGAFGSRRWKLPMRAVEADVRPHPRSLGKCERDSMARYWNHSRLLRRLWHGRQRSLRDGGEAECARPRAQPRPTHEPCRVPPPVAFPRCCARGRAPSGAAHRGVPAGNSSGRAVGHLAVSSVRREFLRRRLNLLVPNDIRASLRRLLQRLIHGQNRRPRLQRPAFALV